MENLQNSGPGVELQEGEVIKYTHPNISMTIKGDDDELVFVHGSLIISTLRVLYVQSLPRKVCVFFRYQNCITHGIDKQNLVCMISDLQEKDPFEEDDDEEDEENGHTKEPDFILEKIKTVDSLEPEDRVQLVGNYQVIFHYSELGQEHLKNLFNVFSECSALNPDDNQPEDDMEDNEFITANDIDENGNLKAHDDASDEEIEAEEGGYEDEDGEDGMGEILANGQHGSKKQKENEKMDLEK